MAAILRLITLFLLLFATPAFADIILLLSDNKPSVVGVADAILSQYKGRVEVINLNSDRGRAAEAVNTVANSPIRQVVAIGLAAARTARQNFSAKQVVFCQVLNYEEFDLVTPWMKGVSAIPSLSRQFQAWKQLNPNLKTIGVIASKSMAAQVREAQAAARANNLELTYAVAESDREVMPMLRHLTGDIGGLWLAPDSRILSGNVIAEVMSYSVKQNIQLLVFSPALLKEGGLLSGSQNFGEIAQLVLSRLKQAQDLEEMHGEAVTPLSQASVNINGKAAERFGLSIPAKLRATANVE